MGTRQKLYDGLMILPEGIADFSNVAANTGATLTSSYQQANPKPGIPRADQDGARAAIRVSGEQGTDLAIRSTRAGVPQLETGGRVIVRDTAGSGPWYGWNDPGLVVGWSPVDYSASTNITYHAAAVNERTGAVVSVYSENAGGIDYSSSAWSPASWEWSAAVLFGSVTNPPAVFWIPGTDRIVAVGKTSYFTDDGGATWNVYASQCDALIPLADRFATTWDRGCAFSLDGDVLLMFFDGNFIYQYVSTDLGATYRRVNSLFAAIGAGSVCTSLNRYVVGYAAITTGYAECRILGTAGSNIQTATAITIDNSQSYDECRVVAEPDGTVWALCRPTTDPNAIIGFISNDGGNTWRAIDDGLSTTRNRFWDSGSAADFIRNMVPVHAAGYLLNIVQWTADVAVYDTSLAAMVLGGWSNLGKIKTLSRQVILSNYSNAAFRTPRSWLPIELPQDTGQWTKTGGGTTSLESPGRLRILTVLNNGYYTSASSVAGSVGTSWYFDLEIAGGGSAGTDQIIFEGQVANGVNEKVCRLRFTTTAVQVFDPTASLTKATVNINTQNRLQYCLVIEDNGSTATQAQLYIRSPGGEWSLEADVQILNNAATPGATNLTRWGHLVNSSAQSLWYMVQSEGPVFTTGDQLTGRWLSRLPVPLPKFGANGGLCFLSATGGPMVEAESWSGSVRADYPIRAVFPSLEPSPARGWRSTDTSEQIITWDLGEQVWIGGAFGLYLGSVNFQGAALEYYDGAVWQTLGTADLRFDASTQRYDISGAVLSPRFGAAARGRYVWENELAGGYVEVPATPSGVVVRRIASNSPGYWVDDTTLQPKIVLEGTDGTEASGFFCTIRHPSGLLVAYPTSEITARYWRVRIPAGQTTAEGYYRAGVIAPMRLVPFGAEASWGQGQQADHNVEVTTDRFGTSRARQRGPQRVNWTMDWSDQTNHLRLRDGSFDVDFIGAAGGNRLAAVEDLGMQLRGIMQQIQGGALPVVAVAALPQATNTITDPTLFNYGHLLSSIRMTQSAGEMGQTEIIRVETITVNGIV